MQRSPYKNAFPRVWQHTIGFPSSYWKDTTTEVNLLDTKKQKAFQNQGQTLSPVILEQYCVFGGWVE